MLPEQVGLKAVRELDPGVRRPLGIATLEQKPALAADDPHFRTPARAAGELRDRFNDAERIMTQHDGEFFGAERVALSLGHGEAL
jgi:hypothetical protein